MTMMNTQLSLKQPYLAPRWRRHVILQGVIVLGWVFLWYAATLLEYAPHASLWFPPAAVTYAAFRILGWRAAPGVFIAALLVTFGADHAYGSNLPWWQVSIGGVLFSLTHGLSYYAGARVMADYLPLHAGRSIPRTVTVFLAIGSGATLLAALGGSYALAAVGMMSFAEARVAWLPWWVGDFAGLMTLAPLLVVGFDRLTDRLGIRRFGSVEFHAGGAPEAAESRRPFLAKLSVALAIIAVTAGAAALFPTAEPIVFLCFFLIIPQMWIVHTERELRSLVSVAILATTIALVTRVFGLGEHALTYQFAMIIIAASSYFGLAVPTLYANNRRLREALNRDDLTGAVTRSRFLEIAEVEIKRAQRYGEPLGLIVFDVDYFKQINDEQGHALGDRVLSELSRQCQAELRPTDVFGRIGGDEFAILLPMTNTATAVDAAERLRRAIRVSSEATTPKVSASFGVVEIAAGRESFKQAFERADRLLYKAKAQGRDQVCRA